MNLDDVQKLIKMIDESGLDQMTIEEGEFKLTLKKTAEAPKGAAAAQGMMMMPNFMPPNFMPPMAAPPAASAPAAPPAATKTEDTAKKYREIRSPMVGTFYRAPSPEANSYVQVGDSITKGKVLCIIEAMKLMNELEADIDGKVVKIMVENGKPVEYDQVLFLVE
jgi:acetyl-CoA carboxylase biotin carboxyl carrier protein